MEIGKSMPVSNEQVRVFRLEGETSDSIKNAADLIDYRDKKLRPLLNEYDVLLVPRGIIACRASLIQVTRPELSSASHPVHDQFAYLNALYHVHGTVFLMPNEKNRISTLITPQDTLAEAISGILEEKEWQNLMSGQALDLKKRKWTFEEVRDSFVAALSPESNSTTPQNQFISDGLTGLRAFLYGFEKDKRYDFISEIQKATTNSLLEIRWPDSDFAAIKEDVYHGRDVRTQYERNEDEQLYAVDGWPNPS